MNIQLMTWETISWPTEFVISFSHQFELQALKSLVIIEQIGISSFILLRSKLKFMQKFSDSSLFWLGERYIQVKKHFSLCERISVTKQLLAWNFAEDRLHHKYSPANFLRLVTTPMLPVGQLWSATTPTARQYPTRIISEVLLNPIAYDAHHCQ